MYAFQMKAPRHTRPTNNMRQLLNILIRLLPGDPHRQNIYILHWKFYKYRTTNTFRVQDNVPSSGDRVPNNFEVTSTEHVVQFFPLDMSTGFSCLEESRLSQCQEGIFSFSSLTTLPKAAWSRDLTQKLLLDRVYCAPFVEQLHNSPLSFAATFEVKSYVLFMWVVGWPGR